MCSWAMLHLGALGKEVRLKGFALPVCGILFGATGGLEEAKKALVDNAMENVTKRILEGDFSCWCLM